eukprot:9420784-Pyramimonas_sp.AAC.1
MLVEDTEENIPTQNRQSEGLKKNIPVRQPIGGARDIPARCGRGRRGTPRATLRRRTPAERYAGTADTARRDTGRRICAHRTSASVRTAPLQQPARIPSVGTRRRLTALVHGTGRYPCPSHHWLTAQ